MQKLGKPLTRIWKYLESYLDKQDFINVPTKELVKDLKISDRQFRKDLKKLQVRKYINYSATRGRYGKYYITRYNKGIETDKVVVKESKKEPSVIMPSKEKTSVRNYNRAKKTTLLQLNEELKRSGLSKDLLTKLQEYKPGYTEEELFGGYLVGILYSTYTYLFLNRDAYNKGKKLPINRGYTVYTKGNILNSAHYTSFVKIYKFCKDSNINPVYYMSSIFSYNEFLAEDKPNLMNKPYPNMFISSYDTFISQQNYDLNNFPGQDIEHPHMTIQFALNKTIAFLNMYFVFTLEQDIKDFTEIVFSKINADVGTLLEDAKLPSIVSGFSELQDKITGSLSAYLQDTKFDIDITENSDLMLNGISRRLMINVFDKHFADYAIKTIKDTNIDTSPISDIRNLYTLYYGEFGLQNDITSGNIIKEDDLRSKINLDKEKFYNISELLKLSKVFSEFNSVRFTVPDTNLIDTNSNISLPKVVQQYGNKYQRESNEVTQLTR